MIFVRFIIIYKFSGTAGVHAHRCDTVLTKHSIWFQNKLYNVCDIATNCKDTCNILLLYILNVNLDFHVCKF